MSQILCTETQARRLLAARNLPIYSRKAEKKAVFQQIHAAYSIPKTQKFVLFIENPMNPLYRVLRDKRTKLPLDDGKGGAAAAIGYDSNVEVIAGVNCCPMCQQKLPVAKAKEVVKASAKAPVKAKAVPKKAVKVVAKVATKKAAKR